MMKKRYLALCLFFLVIVSIAYVLYPSSAGNRQFSSIVVKTFSKDFINVHAVSVNEKIILIDSGMQGFEADIESFLAENEIDPFSISALILTHGHHDHAGTAAYFQKKFGIPIIAGRGDRGAYETGKNNTLCPTGAFANFRHGMDQKGRFPPFSPDIWVDNSLDLESFIDVKGEVYSLPSHTFGSLVIVIDEIALVGDLFRGGILFKQHAATHFYQCNLTAVNNDIERILTDLAPNAKTFFPSHLGPIKREAVIDFWTND